MQPLTRQGELEVVGTYRFAHEAFLAKSTLEAFEVPAWILDENQIRFRWFMADALGGVKIAVRAGDAEKAKEILAGDHSAALENIPEEGLPPAPEEICPQCGVATLEVSRKHTQGGLGQLGLLLLAWLFTGGPAPHYVTRTTVQCRSCGYHSP